MHIFLYFKHPLSLGVHHGAPFYVVIFYFLLALDPGTPNHFHNLIPHHALLNCTSNSKVHTCASHFSLKQQSHSILISSFFHQFWRTGRYSLCNREKNPVFADQVCDMGCMNLINHHWTRICKNKLNVSLSETTMQLF